MGQYDSLFWDELDRYHDFVKRYEQNVEITYPPKGKCPVCGQCSFGATNITYREYRGPNIQRVK